MPDDGGAAFRPDLIRLEAQPGAMVVSHSRTVWVGDRDGMLGTGPEHGCFVHETRLLTRLLWELNDGLYTVEASPVRQNSFLSYAIAAPRRRHPGYRSSGSLGARDSTEQTIGLRLATVLSDGFHQDAVIENFTLLPQDLTLTITFAADFADFDEAARRQRQQRGRLRLQQESSPGECRIRWDYHAHHRSARLDRGACLQFAGLPDAARCRAGQLRARWTLAPGQRHHLCLTLAGHIEGWEFAPDPGCFRFAARDPTPARYTATSTAVVQPSHHSRRYFHATERAREDLAALYVRDLDVSHRSTPPPHAPAWLPAVGIPSYMAVFGRDDLTVGWQSALFSPELLRGALIVLRDYQGTRDDPWRDEYPGKILHEAHTGPLATLLYRPQGRYYGSFDASPFYVICLSEYFHWTGDRATTLDLLPAARAAMAWMELHGHPGPRHFYSYQTRSSQGLKNQGWKDSGDAIVDHHGHVIPDPIAACSIQGYAYDALLRIAELEWLAGNRGAAARAIARAHELKRRFNDRFWLAGEQYFAMALDPKGRPVASVASDPGDALASGIVDREHVASVADRLFAPGLFSGWGIRTLSAAHVAFNPFSYHRGSVWPVENAVIGVGLRRYGFLDRLAQLLAAQLEVSAWFQHARLPEVFSGHARDHEHPFPAVYPKANSPQAWSAGVMPLWTQMLVGLYPYAPRQMLFLDPALPNWLPELALENLRVGDATVSLRFWREANGHTAYAVTHLTGTLCIVRQPSPWSLFASTRERLEDLLESWAA